MDTALFSQPSLPTRDGVSASCVALPSGPWPTVADFLAERFSRFPLEEWQERMRRGDVLDALGNRIPPDSVYRPNGKIFYYRSMPFELPIPFEETVIYQDDLIVVADKPHFLPVVPSGRYVKETLLARLKRKIGIDTLAPVHRIDLDTAGLVMFTIQPKTRNAFQAMFRKRVVEKRYEAIAADLDALAEPTVIRNRLAEAASSFMQMQQVDGEPNAETYIERIASNGSLARYALQPVTGQRHQLRVHMAGLGIPILHDRIYPVLEPELPLGEQPDFTKPLQLLARSISFTDPITGAKRHFESKRCLTF